MMTFSEAKVITKGIFSFYFSQSRNVLQFQKSNKLFLCFNVRFFRLHLKLYY